MNVKLIVHTKNIIAGLLAHIFVRIANIEKVLLIIQWLSVLKLYLLWILHQQKWHTIAANVSTNPDDKKVRYNIDCYILHTALILIILLLLIITIICYYYAKQESIKM